MEELHNRSNLLEMAHKQVSVPRLSTSLPLELISEAIADAFKSLGYSAPTTDQSVVLRWRSSLRPRNKLNLIINWVLCYYRILASLQQSHNENVLIHTFAALHHEWHRFKTNFKAGWSAQFFFIKPPTTKSTS